MRSFFGVPVPDDFLPIRVPVILFFLWEATGLPPRD